jgi:two-component system sensor histidine kinase MprB
MSLRLRLAVVLAVVATFGIASASAAAYVSTSRELHAEIDRSLESRTRRVLDDLERPQGRPGRRPAAPMDGPALQVLSADGTPRTDVQDTSALPIDGADLALARAGAGVSVRTVAISGVSYRLRTEGVTGGGAVQVARELEETESVLGSLRSRMILLTVTGGVVAAMLAFVVARRAIRPVEQLTAAAEHVAATEDLATPIPVERADELGRLASSFNAMLRALGASREEQRRLVDDAGHELRTPLTSLRTNLEVLQQEARLDPADRARLLADVDAELSELTALVDELVALARGSSEEDVDDVRLDLVVADSVERLRRRTGRDVVLTSEPVTVRGRRAQLDRAVTNLLGNAAKFSPRDEPIEVVVDGPCISVRDHGPGIPVEDRAHVFERFFRADSARSTSGSGLGLAIVDQVVRAHGGEVFVDDAPGGGAVVGFRLG